MALAISFVTAPRIVEVWDRVGPILQKAVEVSGERFTVAALLKALEAGEYQLWVVHDEEGRIVAANTTQFTAYPNLRVITGRYIAGDRLEEWKDRMCEIIETVARNTECKRVEFVGRRGWGKVLAPNGYQETAVTYEKVL